MKKHLQEKWESYATSCMPPNAGSDQHKDMRNAFFIGALTVFQSLCIHQDGNLTEAELDEKVQKALDVRKELQDYYREATADVGNRH